MYKTPDRHEINGLQSGAYYFCSDLFRFNVKPGPWFRFTRRVLARVFLHFKSFMIRLNQFCPYSALHRYTWGATCTCKFDIYLDSSHFVVNVEY